MSKPIIDLFSFFEIPARASMSVAYHWLGQHACMLQRIKESLNVLILPCKVMRSGLISIAT